jgi:hypothetical protein
VIHYVTKVWSDASGRLPRTASGGINTYIFDHTLAERPRAKPPLCRREERS